MPLLGIYITLAKRHGDRKRKKAIFAGIFHRQPNAALPQTCQASTRPLRLTPGAQLPPMTTPLLYYIAAAARWQAAQESGQYVPASFAADGFIHCSTAAQVVEVANALYRNQIGLALLVIDPAHVAAPIVYEDLYQSGQDFPHIYGPLPTTAVLAALPFAPDGDGCFHLPAWSPNKF